MIAIDKAQIPRFSEGCGRRVELVHPAEPLPQCRVFLPTQALWSTDEGDLLRDAVFVALHRPVCPVEKSAAET